MCRPASYVTARSIGYAKLLMCLGGFLRRIGVLTKVVKWCVLAKCARYHYIHAEPAHHQPHARGVPMLS